LVVVGTYQQSDTRRRRRYKLFQSLFGRQQSRKPHSLYLQSMSAQIAEGSDTVHEHDWRTNKGRNTANTAIARNIIREAASNSLLAALTDLNTPNLHYPVAVDRISITKQSRATSIHWLLAL